jgi:hypothetical protein
LGTAVAYGLIYIPDFFIQVVDPIERPKHPEYLNQQTEYSFRTLFFKLQKTPQVISPS